MLEQINFKRFFLVCLISAIVVSCNQSAGGDNSARNEKGKLAMVIHGGAGTIKKENMDAATEAAYREKLHEALQAGYKVLQEGGSSCEAIQQAIILMENSPLFNAGVGAVFTSTGENELDASIMRGSDLNAGAIAGVKTIKNPIRAAYEVMVNSPHVMLAREGAEAFATERNLEIVNPEYFKTERRFRQLEKVIKKEFGTVGAVAVDREGNICAATSTGGMTNKRWGRIGDSPVIGAGTYANNKTCGFSGTGHGEYYIRAVAAYDVSALMEYKSMSVEEAAETVMEKLTAMEASGGMIALDADGNVAMPFNTSGMYRGYLREGEEPVVKIFKEE